MNEPSALDVILEKIRFWKKKKAEPEEQHSQEVKPVPDFGTGKSSRQHFPYLTILCVCLALLAQFFLEPPNRIVTYALILYSGSAAALVGGILRKEWTLPAASEQQDVPISTKVKWKPLLISIPFFAAAFITFGKNQFTALNCLLWFTGLVLIFIALWLPVKKKKSIREWFQKVRNIKLSVTIKPWTVLLIVTMLVIIFFRVYQLNQTPGEMFSDHAEKLLDVADVLNGKFSIFFPRNTGREAIQMYLTAAIAKLLGTGLSFISLKIGTVLAGLFALPFIYLLGKEIANKWVGWLALVLAGVAYWPNVISRVGLRFPLYPAFAAPCLYFLIKGLRRANRNDLLLSGLFLGLGLHGYSPFRFVPVVVVFAFLLFIVHPSARGKRIPALWNLVILAGVAFAVFLPLFRYFLDDPAGFSSRALSRLGSIEQTLPGPALKIFFSNLAKACVMFFYDNGEIWVHSIPHRPALDVITAAFFFIGVILLFVRYIRSKNWGDLFLILSIPLLMMPSILSLAFPTENPSLNRTGGAIIPVFIIAGFGFCCVFSTIWQKLRGIPGKVFTVICASGLILGICTLNYDLVFRQYHDEFLAGAWNTSDIGSVIKGFTQSIGNPDNAYVVPYPYWVDTRLVGINAGFPEKDYALWPDSFETTLTAAGPKLFIIKAEDTVDTNQLLALYPSAVKFHYADQWPGKDFTILLVTNP